MLNAIYGFIPVELGAQMTLETLDMSDKEPRPQAALNIAKVREELGDLWGLGRPITRAELARSLDLSPKHGGSHISKLEKDQTGLSGPIHVAIQMMLDGAVPYTTANIVKPGYPRGPAR